MRVQAVWRTAAAVLMAVFVVVVLGASDIQSQQQRNRRSRRTTNPVRRSSSQQPPAAASPTPAARPQTDATIISTAGEPTPEDTGAAESRRTTSSRRRTRAQTTQTEDDQQQQLRSTVNRLADQVTKLSADLSSLKDQQRTLVDLERLTRAEQRAEGFREQLRDVTEKELGLQARLEQIEYELQPDAIERRSALTGTLRPSELRDQIRRQLESERSRVQQQLNLFTTSRSRLEAAVTTSDLEVERLRARLDEADRRAAEAGATTENTQPTSAPTPEPPTQGEPPVDIP